MSKLLELTKKGKQGWIGLRPPFPMDAMDMLNCTNYRMPAEYHGKYDVVWIFEHSFGNSKNNGWKIAVDESIRLLKENGKLIVRCIDNLNITMVAIKNYLGRHIGIEVSIDFEISDKCSSELITCFNIHRLNFKIYKNRKWTFAILTSGKKKGNVELFIRSIRKKEKDKSQIIISGSHESDFDKYDVEYMDLSPFRDEEYAEISRKKNALAQMAAEENILIAHDRFVLNPDFFEGFEKYGYDFDYLTIRQFYESGKEYPAYCCAEREGLIWSKPYHIHNLNQLYSTMYLNGGLLIFKTKILRKIGFNSLLMWNQMEDVELCKEFMERGIVPRFNFMSSAKTVGVDEDYTDTFIDYKMDIRIMPNPLKLSGIRSSGVNDIYGKIAAKIPVSVKQTGMYQTVREGILRRYR